MLSDEFRAMPGSSGSLMLGRVLNGRGEHIDGGLLEDQRKSVDINETPVNYHSHKAPSGFIQTGISAIDGLNPIVCGQRMAIFSTSGLPHNRLAAQIARQAILNSNHKEHEKFAVVFAAIGISFYEASSFVEDFRKTGSLDRTILYINLADDPIAERASAPRQALATAEHLAFVHGMHVLVILSEISPACIYTDAMYERAGRLKGKGSITQVPIFTMPGNDKANPAYDLACYATDGQIVLSHHLHCKGIYPPVDALPSMSRLMNNRIGKEKTREDHADLINQLFSAYVRGKEVQELTIVNGALIEEDKIFAAFSDAFEDRYVRQSEYENRTLEGTLETGWDILTMLPIKELNRIRDAYIERYLKPRMGDLPLT